MPISLPLLKLRWEGCPAGLAYPLVCPLRPLPMGAPALVPLDKVLMREAVPWFLTGSRRSEEEKEASYGLIGGEADDCISGDGPMGRANGSTTAAGMADGS